MDAMGVVNTQSQQNQGCGSNYVLPVLDSVLSFSR